MNYDAEYWEKFYDQDRDNWELDTDYCSEDEVD